MMPMPSQLSPVPRKHSAKTLNARLARTTHINDENTSLISQCTQYCSHPSPSLSPPRTFTNPISPPPPFYPRLEPHTPTLHALDKVYLESEHPILDGYRMIGAGGIGNPWDVEKRERREEPGLNFEGVEVQMRTKDAIRVLENHIRDRIPFAQVASRRMQAVMGARNEIAFDLPEVRRSSGNGYQAELNGLDAGSASRAVPRKIQLAPERIRDSGFASGFNNPHSPLSSPKVNSETGKGLREWLLSKGKEFGMLKKECRSISFHDFSPDMRNNSWSNKLLGHYAVREGQEGRERVDYYEVDLPTTTIDPETGTPTATSETWLWFLISRPVVSVDPSNTSTCPSAPENDTSPSIQSTLKYYTPATHPSSPTLIPTTASDSYSVVEQSTNPPPNFTYPIPISWLVFACPLANTTSYPESVEKHPQQSSTLHSTKSKYPFTNGKKKGKKIYKRKDFDISHNGLPIFEFNSSSLFSGSQPSFLSVEGIGPWFEDDDYAEIGQERYKEMAERWLEEGGKGEKPSPYKGRWWREFFAAAAKDRERWEEVRGAMGRGKCRVVVRWVEFEPESGDEDIEMHDEGKWGGGNTGGGGGGGSGKRIKERIVGRQGRVTRSEVKKGSALGFSVRGSGVAMGFDSPGLVENARARAMGNRDMKKGRVWKR